MLRISGKRTHLVDRLGGELRRVAADLQQREDQRREFVAHRQAGEAHADVARPARLSENDGTALGAVTTFGQREFVGERGDVVQHALQLARLVAVVERHRDFDRLG